MRTYALPRRLLPLLLFVFASLVAATVLADAKTEKEAQALQKKAIEEDNLNVNYPAAIKKLQAAVNKCGDDKCSASLRGSLLRDLGAMQILNGAVDDGRANFDEAIKADASLDLDPSYKNPMLENMWTAEKKKAGVSTSATTPPPPPPPPTGTGTKPPPGGGGQPSGDFVHAPPNEGLQRTPLPVYVEYPGGGALARVLVKYHGFGMAESEWKSIDLQKKGSGYGSYIPCKDAMQGVMKYYIQGFDASNDPVATSGSRTKPYTVNIKTSIAGAPPALPGDEAPKQCEEAGECPPDFPGCKEQTKKKDNGEDCDKDKECKSNSCVGGKCVEKKAGGEECDKDEECASNSCSDGKCTEGKKGGGEECESDDQCKSGKCKHEKCAEGGDETPGAKFPRIWVGLAVQIDNYLVPSANDVCKLSPDGKTPATSGNPYWCVDANTGADFPADPTTNGNIVQGRSDQVQGGFKALSNIRALVSIDYALSMNMLAGIRGGYVLFTYPGAKAGAFAPIHVEGRLTYLIGKDALTKKGFAPMVFGAGGAGEFDAFVPVVVFQQGQQPGTNANAWVVGGPAFGAVGVGGRMLLAPKTAATFAVKGEVAFGGNAGTLIGVAPEVGLQIGF